MQKLIQTIENLTYTDKKLTVKEQIFYFITGISAFIMSAWLYFN